MPFASRCEASAAVVELLEGAVRENVCTAWSAACKDWHASAFYADEGAPGTRGGPHPVFDLASLTKPLFLPAVARVSGLESDWWNAPRGGWEGLPAARLRDHRSGARAWLWMGRGTFAFKDGERTAKAHFEGRSRAQARAHADGVLEEACRSYLAAGVRSGESERTVYSDVNYFLLAKALEKAVPGGLEAGLARLNSSQGAAFRHASFEAGKAVPALPYFPYVSVDAQTATGEEPGPVTFGPVHDTNANILAGPAGGVVSGHAGFFGNVADVDKALHGIADGLRIMGCGVGLWGMRDSGRNSGGDFDGSANARFVGGLDTPSGAASTAGLRNFPPAAHGSIVGHLGFTGTSFWFERDDAGEIRSRHILLTNRTASRTAYGSVVPRLLVFTSVTGEWVWGGISRAPGTGFVEIPEEEWRATAFEHASARILLWNRHELRSPPDVSGLRRRFGLLAWDA